MRSSPLYAPYLCSTRCYELGVAFVRVNLEGVCKKDLIYYEKGQALFQGLNVTNNTYTGDVRFQASEARLIVQVRGEGCGSFAGTKRYNLKPLTAYYKFGFTESVGFQLGCEWPKHRWQFAVCVNSAGWNSYRKRP